MGEPLEKTANRGPNMTTVHDVLSVISETRDQITKAEKLLARAATAKPGVLAHLVEPTIRFRDRMRGDLAVLEAELEKLAL